jgi:hypothetical protein
LKFEDLKFEEFESLTFEEFEWLKSLKGLRVLSEI